MTKIRTIYSSSEHPDLDEDIDNEQVSGNAGAEVNDPPLAERQSQQQQRRASSRCSLYAPSVASRRSFLSLPYSSQSEYTPLHLVPAPTTPAPAPTYIHTCPSCRGTLGSVPSSNSSFYESRSQKSSRSGPQIDLSDHVKNDPNFVKRHSHIREYKSPEPRVANSDLVRSPYLTFQSPSQANFPHSVTSSYLYPSAQAFPTTAPCTCSFHSRATAVYTRHAARLYIPIDYTSPTHKSQRAIAAKVGGASASALPIDLIHEHEAVRASSAAAVHGSCSSDANPSDTSAECDCSKYSCQADSTRSTYGSSENKDSSDISSCDSCNAYCGKDSASSVDDNHKVVKSIGGNGNSNNSKFHYTQGQSKQHRASSAV